MAIVFGAVVFVLGLIPNVIVTFTDELRNLRGDFLPDMRTDPPDPSDSAQVWLLVSGQR